MTDQCIFLLRPPWLYLPNVIHQAVQFFVRVLSIREESDGAALPWASDAHAQAEHMLKSYGNAVLRLAYSYLHNMADAEEVLQDALIKFLQTAPVLENEKHQKAWLFKVAANLSKDRIKYNALRKTDELSESLAAENQEDLSEVWEAVKALPVKYREAIYLFYYENYSISEISKITGAKESTVKSNLFRGRKLLKDILEDRYGF